VARWGGGYLYPAMWLVHWRPWTHGGGFPHWSQGRLLLVGRTTGALEAQASPRRCHFALL